MFLHMLLLYGNPVYSFIIIAAYFLFSSLIPNNGRDINLCNLFIEYGMKRFHSRSWNAIDPCRYKSEVRAILFIVE